MSSMIIPGLLSEAGRFRVTRPLRRIPWVRRTAQASLRRAVLADVDALPNDVTVLIGVRNRSDHRLVNALRSIRDQTHPAEWVHPVVVDYGSDTAHAQRTLEVCRDFDVECVRVEIGGMWSRSRCLNVGIRPATTKYLLTSDVDVVFSDRYLADAVEALRGSPFSVVGAPMLDLPEESVEHFRRSAETGEALDLEYWKERSSRRLDIDFHPSIGMTSTAFYQLIRGYDEYFEGWGAEDRDLMRRLWYLGLSPQPVGSTSFYLHQWHPKFEDVSGGEDAPVIKENHRYLEHHHTILRNDDDWGRATGRDEAPNSPALRGESSQPG
jgi:hypothetical protein